MPPLKISPYNIILALLLLMVFFSCRTIKPPQNAILFTPDLSAGQVINLFQPENKSDSSLTGTDYMTRLDLCRALFRIAEPAVMLNGPRFSDQGLNPEDSLAISHMVALKIMEVYPDGTFKPRLFLTRAGLAFYLYLFLNVNPDFKSDQAFTSDFRDVGHYTMVSPAVKFCISQGLLNPVGQDEFGSSLLVNAQEFEIVMKRVRTIYQPNCNAFPSSKPESGR
jgi:hypothetical protein